MRPHDRGRVRSSLHDVVTHGDRNRTATGLGYSAEPLSQPPTKQGMRLDHDDFGLNRSKVMNVTDSKVIERDAGGKPVSTFPHPALGSVIAETSLATASG